MVLHPVFVWQLHLAYLSFYWHHHNTVHVLY